MNTNKKIALLGGGGKTGIYLVQQLLKEGFQLKVLVREPSSFPIQHTNIQTIQGDALQFSVIEELVQDCDVVINTIGQRAGEALVVSVSTMHLIKAMKEKGIKKYVVLSGINIDDPNDEKGESTQMATDWMKANFAVPHMDKQKSHDVLRENFSHWVTVRVPLIVFTEDSLPLKVNLKDCLGTQVYAKDVAQFMIDQIASDQYQGQAPFIAN